MLIKEQITISKKEYDGLTSLILELEQEIRLLKNGEKSITSHTSPSHDIGRSNILTLREKTDIKSGGQIGHQGNTLEMIDNPDEIINYSSIYCTSCS